MTHNVLLEKEASWADKPNRLTLHAGSSDCPAPQTSVTVFLTTGTHLVTVLVNKRGWDIPGGHIEPGETVLEAAAREVREEAGISIGEEELELVGWTHLEVLADKPAGYAYPYPHTYQPVYVCRLASERVANLATSMPEEIGGVSLITHANALTVFRQKDWLALLLHLTQS